MSCCKSRDVVFPSLREPPDLLKRLLLSQHPESNAFFKNIRQFNAAFAFTSIKYTPDCRLSPNAYNTSFQIQGELYHLQGPLNPQDGDDPSYAKYFIYSPEKATARHHGQSSNLPPTLRVLDEMIREFNPYYHIYKTAREVLNEASESQETRTVITPPAESDYGERRVSTPWKLTHGPRGCPSDPWRG